MSRPIRLALEDEVINTETDVFDYGCGRGGDIRHLKALGIRAAGWDPAFAPTVTRVLADVVNLGYVVNVVEDPAERRAALASAWALAKRTLIVAARMRWEASSVTGADHGDGIVTSAQTFQKFFTQEELRSWIDETLGVRCVTAAPGIFYVFRDTADAQLYLARQARRASPRAGLRVADLLYEQYREPLDLLRSYVEEHRRLPADGELGPQAEVLAEAFGSVRASFALIRKVTGPEPWTDVEIPGRQRVSEKRFNQHQELLEPLLAFLAERGRLPRESEVTTGEAIGAEFGSIRAAYALVRRVTGPERWQQFEAHARRSFLVYLALSAFAGRPRFSELPPDLQHDTRDFFGTFKSACSEADRLLFAAGDRDAIDLACRASAVGKRTPEALYVHVAGIGHLPAILRVYEGCARALTGSVESATLLKLHRLKPQVSYLEYPSFDKDPHPALSTVVIGRLGKLDVTFRDFRDSANPPVLHRKEAFVPEDYPGRDAFARLTGQEERHGLLDAAASIGTREGWDARLTEFGFALRGHRLVRRPATSTTG